MNFNFKEALQDTKRKFVEKTSPEYTAVEYLKIFNENLSHLSNNTFFEIKDINFFIKKIIASDEYLLNVSYTNSKKEIHDFLFDVRRWYQDKQEVEAIFKAIKEKLEKDGFKIDDSYFINSSYDGCIDFFSIEID